MPFAQCPTCKEIIPLMPRLVDPLTHEAISEEDWYRRISAHFGFPVGPEDNVPMYCEEHAEEEAGKRTR